MDIRELKKKDAILMEEWMNSKDISKSFQFQMEDISIERCESFIRKAQRNVMSLHLAIVDDNDEYMGTISLKNIDFSNKKGEYAIVLRSVAIGKGYAKFATDAILYLAFYMLDLHRVYLNVFEDNIRANKFYVKYGFIQEGKFKESLLVHGQYKDVVWYRLLKNEYDKKYEKNDLIIAKKNINKIYKHIKRIKCRAIPGVYVIS